MIRTLFHRLVPLRVRASMRAVLMHWKKRLSSFEVSSDRPSSVRARLVGLAAEAVALDANSALEFIPAKIACLKLDVSENVSRRINLLMSEINFQYLFAGSLCMFNLALELKRNGHNVRIIVVDPSYYNPSQWKRELADYEDLQGFFNEVEVVYAANRAKSVDVSPSDAFVATSWWTAHIAHQATRQLRRGQFVYLIQEYEPLFYPGGSLFALAEQAYTFPHHAIFSTEFLRDYFQEQRVGVFASEVNGHETSNPVVIRNAINSVQINEVDLRSRERKRLLFYARPDQRNNARNAFELGVLAIRDALKEGHFDPSRWEVHGMGAMSQYKNIPLPGRAELKMLPAVSLPDFIKVLPTYDVGLSLMLSPHPGMMPLDMAAAGLVTVTNAYATKTAEKLSELSENIIAVPPTLEGLKAGLAAAHDEVNNYAKRIAGSQVNWSTSWSETFSGSIMARIEEYLA